MHVRSLLFIAACLLTLNMGSASAPVSATATGAVLAAAPEGALLFSLQDDESARIQQMFSRQPMYSRPAPRVWSSRLEIRWTARWQAAPRYAV